MHVGLSLLVFVIGIAVGAAITRLRAAGQALERCANCQVADRAVARMLADDESVERLENDIARLTIATPQIALDAIVAIESGGDAAAVGAVGERGLCQIRESTWHEWTECMGQRWDFDAAFDPGINRAVAHYGLNTRIPQMLSVYGISDTVAHRLAAYHWGIGNLFRARQAARALPEQVQQYIRRYHEACEQLARRRQGE